MKILVATDAGQDRPGDFCWTTPGEMVTLGLVCDSDLDAPDAGCGCGRAFVGTDTRKGTTTAIVSEVDMILADYARTLRNTAVRAGFTISAGFEAVRMAQHITAAVKDLPVGTVVRRRLDDILPND